MLKLLEDGRVPFAQEGELLLPIGQKWSMPPYRGQYLRILATEPTTYEKVINTAAGAATGNGVLVPGIPVAGVVPAASIIQPVNLDTEMQPQAIDIVMQVRVGLPYKSGLALYFMYLQNSMRGGLYQAPTNTPDPTNSLTRYLGHYTDDDTPAACPRFQVWFTFGKYPGFALANHSNVHQKAVLTFKIQKCRIEAIDKATFDDSVAQGVRWHPMLAEDALVL